MEKSGNKTGRRIKPVIVAVVVLLVIMLIVLVQAFSSKSSGQSSSAPQASGTGGMNAVGAEGSVSDAGNPLSSHFASSTTVSASVGSSLQSASSNSSSSTEGKAAADNAGGSKITKDQYDQLETGMTYDEVAAALGSTGSPVMGAGNTQVYEWAAQGHSGAFTRLSFKNGKLSKKYRFGF